MSRLRWLASKSKAVVKKGPSTLRNIIYARFEYWPVSGLSECDLKSIPVHCISLVRAKKRRRLISRQVEKLGLDRFHFVDAIEGRSLDVEDLIQEGIYDEHKSMECHSTGLTRNEIACSLSHGKAYSEIVSLAYPVALIIEDDALFLQERIRSFTFQDVPQDFDVVFLNSFRYEEPPKGHLRGVIYDVTSYT